MPRLSWREWAVRHTLSHVYILLSAIYRDTEFLGVDQRRIACQYSPCAAMHILFSASLYATLLFRIENSDQILTGPETDRSTTHQLAIDHFAFVLEMAS